MADFEKIAEAIRNSPPGDFDDATKLKFYKLYKQATVGDCNTEQPGMLSFQERAKWDAWSSVKGMNKDEAKKQYVEEYNKTKK